MEKIKEVLKIKIISDGLASALFLLMAFFSVLMTVMSTPAMFGATILFNLLGLLYGIRELRVHKISGVILICVNLLFIPFLAVGIPLLMKFSS
ncbi:MAG: hypothetical protein KAI72_04975 [Candidatus Pacebacteria bacterium]|nr:hypothetical protein [Candidatus Paceibacterota bacterium]